MENIDLQDWYTAQEAAKKLGTTPKYVRTLGIQYKKFRTHKLHDHVMLYRKADVDSYQIGRGKREKHSTKEISETESAA